MSKLEKLKFWLEYYKGKLEIVNRQHPLSADNSKLTLIIESLEFYIKHLEEENNE